MKLSKIQIKNFRRLEDVRIDLEDGETVFVGPNNSGKTSATAVFRYFLKGSEFRIHDFSVSRIGEIDQFGSAEDRERFKLPSIDLDLWFKIDPDIEFGRVFSLLPDTLSDLDEVGIRISFAVKQDDVEDLVSSFGTAKSIKKDEATRDKFTLSRFLSLEGNLKKYFRLRYFVQQTVAKDQVEEVGLVWSDILQKLVKKGWAEQIDQNKMRLTVDLVAKQNAVKEEFGDDFDKIFPVLLQSSSALEPSEAERVLSSLLRIDFVDAQRNIDDQEASRSNRLSAAFAAFYKHNLEEPAINQAASQVIDDNNQNLSAHYETTFKDLMGVISKLGVPSVTDRALKIVSTLNPETALKGNTELLYVDSSLNHELPEAYNGLGFKNLIYIAIQVTHYHLQWINTKVGDSLDAGTLIRTGIRSSIQIRLHTAALVQVRPVSRILLADLASGPGYEKSRINLHYGVIRAGIVADKVNADFQISTPAAVLSREGTQGIEMSYDPATGNFYAGLDTEGLIQILKTISNQRRAITPGQFVTQAFQRWVETAVFIHMVSFVDPFGTTTIEGLFYALNSGGRTVLNATGPNNPNSALGAGTQFNNKNTKQSNNQIPKPTIPTYNYRYGNFGTHIPEMESNETPSTFRKRMAR